MRFASKSTLDSARTGISTAGSRPLVTCCAMDCASVVIFVLVSPLVTARFFRRPVFFDDVAVVRGEVLAVDRRVFFFVVLVFFFFAMSVLLLYE